MDRLAEQIVAWHNRHPLAVRIRARDVHTIGVVALPFMRSSPRKEGGGLIEPVLTDAVSPEELKGAEAAPVAGPSPAGSPLPAWRRWLPQKARSVWPAFSERFLPGLWTWQISRFAQRNGYPDPPANQEAMPWRVVNIDEGLASPPGSPGGWPFEIYLMTAGIDAGKRRSRVLAGRGYPSAIIGRRCWSPWRVAAAAALVAAIAAPAVWWWWQTKPDAQAPTAAAAAASAAALAASGSASAEAPASAAALPASAASATEPAASAAAEPTSGASAAEATDGDGKRDIRPRFVTPLPGRDGAPRPPIGGGKPRPSASEPEAAPSGKGEEPKAGKPGSESAPGKAGASADRKAEGKSDGKSAGKADAKAAPAPRPGEAILAKLANKPAVALVGPPGTKAEAEALLKRMRAALSGVTKDPDSLQAQVVETPAGWRATVWPFASREQAQLINATLVAQGLKTKAIDF
jgi:hypothetical protein